MRRSCAVVVDRDVLRQADADAADRVERQAIRRGPLLHGRDVELVDDVVDEGADGARADPQQHAVTLAQRAVRQHRDGAGQVAASSGSARRRRR